MSFFWHYCRNKRAISFARNKQRERFAAERKRAGFQLFNCFQRIALRSAHRTRLPFTSSSGRLSSCREPLLQKKQALSAYLPKGLLYHQVGNTGFEPATSWPPGDPWNRQPFNEMPCFSMFYRLKWLSRQVSISLVLHHERMENGSFRGKRFDSSTK